MTREEEVGGLVALIRSNVDWKNYLGSKYSQILADVESFYSNPNCSCKQRLRQWGEKNYDIFIKEYHYKKEDFGLPELTPDLEVKAVNELKPQPRKSVIGEVIEIPPDPEEYKQLIKDSQKERWIYRGLSVLETHKKVDGKEEPVWLVFFY